MPIIGKRRLAELVETEATRRSREMILEDRERQLARTNEAPILASALSLVLRSTIDKDISFDGSDDLRTPGAWGTAYRIRGYGGRLLFAVMPFDNPQRMQLGDTRYAPLNGTFRHPEPDARRPRRAIDGADIQAWVGYVQSIAEGDNPAEVLDIDGDGVSSIEDREGMRARMAALGNKVIKRCGLVPAELVEHVQSYAEGRMLQSDQLAAEHLSGAVAIDLPQPAEAIAR